jgi:hypothetical protein
VVELARDGLPRLTGPEASVPGRALAARHGVTPAAVMVAASGPLAPPAPPERCGTGLGPVRPAVKAVTVTPARDHSLSGWHSVKALRSRYYGKIEI